MRVSDFLYHIVRRIACGASALALCATPVFAASWSSTIEVSATVVSSCTLTFMTSPATPQAHSTCTRGEQAQVSLMTPSALAAPLPEIAQTPGPGPTKVLVVTY